MDILATISTILGGIATIVAVIVSYIVYMGQKKISMTIHEEQQRLSQRQIIVPLWEYLSEITDIDPQNPVTPHVVKALNTLELVAICCEGGMIDEKVIIRTFKDQFIKHYDSIKKCKEVKGYNPIKSGDELLKENRATMRFYDHLIELEKNRDKLNKITS